MSFKLFGYQGGQVNLLKEILPLIPEHELYVEVFGGSGTVLFAKDPSPIEVLNDINGDIVNLFLVVQNHYSAFRRHMKFPVFSRHIYEKWRADLRASDVRYVGHDVKRAVKFFYVFNCGFTSNPIPSTFSSCNTMNKTKALDVRMKKTLRVVHDRLRLVSLENMDFRDLIKRYDKEETFFYLDPPYFAPTVDLYAHNMTLRDHGDLRRCLKKIKGKFLLTYDNAKAIRVMYKRFFMKKVSSVVSLTHRHDSTGKYLGGGKEKQSHLFIANYDIEDMEFDQFTTSTRLRECL